MTELKINKQGVQVSVGSKWEHVSHLSFTGSPFKVMGFIDGWAVIRRKNCAPLCVHINTFGTEYLPK